VELPQWYGCVTLSATDASVTPHDAAGTWRAGALTVHRATEGCDLAGFDAGASAVVFDGYLFDRREVADELSVDPDQAGDATLVRAAYGRWGADLFDRLDGCYLVAVWDGKARRLLLGHDALGRHPAFYSVGDKAVWFSSNVLALARSGRVPTRPNRVSLALGGLLYWPDAGETFFESVRRVQPGHYVEAQSTGLHERKYWEPAPAADEPWLDERVVHESFEPLLTKAVTRCLDLGAQGLMLSGGVDSVTIATVAARVLSAAGRPPLVAVSARTGHAPSPEEVLQPLVAKALSMPWFSTTRLEWIDGRDPIEMSLGEVPDLPAPTDVWWVGTYTEFYRRTAARDLRVLVTGSGGDNWLSVDGSHAADLLGRFKLLEFYRFVKSDVTTGGSSLAGALARKLWTNGLRFHLDSAWARLAPAAKGAYHRRKWVERLPAWLAPDRRLRDELVARLVARRTPSLAPDGRRPKSFYLHWMRATPNPHLHHEYETAFHVESGCGVRLLTPYHDSRLVRFFNRIPPRVLVHGDRYKGLLRPLVARDLPGLGLESQRKEYSRVVGEQRLQEIRGSLLRTWPGFGLDALASSGVVDPVELKKATGSTLVRGFDDAARLFMLMSSERWIEANAGN
jgi:asparagine synthetase B (glutamine-hydrolysing)